MLVAPKGHHSSSVIKEAKPKITVSFHLFTFRKQFEAIMDFYLLSFAANFLPHETELGPDFT